MKNKDFFFMQYNKINGKIKIKQKLILQLPHIIKEIILKKKGPELKLFDMGFGIGFFMKMLLAEAKEKYSKLLIEGCEPSEKNFNALKNKEFKISQKPFQEFQTDQKFDFITSIYVFPHFTSEDLEKSLQKNLLNA
jgi:2-polyprenyl-3-methyl-5-hydroxy-6-metoxy-1,4-benzoquinol methylase